MDFDVEDSPIVVVTGPQERAGRAVAEKNRHVATFVAEVERGRVDLGAHQQDALVHAASNPRVGDLHAVEEATALVAHVECGHPPEAELVTQEAAAAGEVEVGRERCEDDRVDLRHVDPGVFTGHLGRWHGEVTGSGAAFLDVAALFDACALLDPLVARVEHFREVVVGDDLRGHVMPQPQNRGPCHVSSPFQLGRA